MTITGRAPAVEPEEAHDQGRHRAWGLGWPDTASPIAPQYCSFRHPRRTDAAPTLGPMGRTRSHVPKAARGHARRRLVVIRALKADATSAGQFRPTLSIAREIAHRSDHPVSKVSCVPMIAGRRLCRCRLHFAEQHGNDQKKRSGRQTHGRASPERPSPTLTLSNCATKVLRWSGRRFRLAPLPYAWRVARCPIKRRRMKEGPPAFGE
jgi:hypothetical protein